MEWYEIAIVLVTLSLFGASMYQASLIRSEKKLSQHPVFAFSLDFSNNQLNLECANIGNGLAKNIEFVIKQHGEPSLETELKIKHNGIAKGNHLLVNNWKKQGWIGIGAYDFDCEIFGSCKDIFNDNHWIYAKLHFDSK